MARKTAAQLAAEAATPVEHASLLEAQLAIQKDIPAFQRDGVNPHFGSQYLSLESLLPQVLEIINRHGVVLTQFPTAVVAGNTVVGGLRTRLTHTATGQFDEDTMLLAAGAESPQKQGSAISFAKRYGLMAILAITADKDDDGNSASRPAAATQAAPVATAPAAQVSGSPFGAAL
jgi:hypothetical protein